MSVITKTLQRQLFVATICQWERRLYLYKKTNTNNFRWRKWLIFFLVFWFFFKLPPDWQGCHPKTCFSWGFPWLPLGTEACEETASLVVPQQPLQEWQMACWVSHIFQSLGSSLEWQWMSSCQSEPSWECLPHPTWGTSSLVQEALLEPQLSFFPFSDRCKNK